MSYGIRVNSCWGASFYISSSISPPSHLNAKFGFPLQFLSSFSVSNFIAAISDFDVLMLCHRFTSNNQINRPLIEQAILNGRLNVHPELQQTDLSEVESAASPVILASPLGQLGHQEQAEKRTLISIRSDIKSALRQIVDQERIESQLIEKQYQQKNPFGKAQAQISSFGKGLYGAGESFLTWMKDVNDVLSLSQRLWRVMKAAAAADSANEGQRYQVFQQRLAESEKKELVEALGFDPAKISVDKFKQAFELANLIYDDHLTQIILTQFVKDYADAQHSLEWSEFSGGAAFEVILTALLALATGGVGAIASLGAQARKISQLKKLGKLFSELADTLKNIPKGKKLTLRKMKEVEDKKGRKASSKKQEKTSLEQNNSSNARVPSNVDMSQEEYDRIINLERGNRPDDVTEYLSKDYVDAHLDKFKKEGGAFVVVEGWISSPDPARQTFQPRGKFVGLSSEMDLIIEKYKKSGNDWKVLRDELNLGENIDLSNERIAYVKIHPEDERFQYEMPTGNESGAYQGEWVPGGFTKNGTAEATLTGGDKIKHDGNIDNLNNTFGNNSERLQ